MVRALEVAGLNLNKAAEIQLTNASAAGQLQTNGVLLKI